MVYTLVCVLAKRTYLKLSFAATTNGDEWTRTFQNRYFTPKTRPNTIYWVQNCSTACVFVCGLICFMHINLQQLPIQLLFYSINTNKIDKSINSIPIKRIHTGGFSLVWQLVSNNSSNISALRRKVFDH